MFKSLLGMSIWLENNSDVINLPSNELVKLMVIYVSSIALLHSAVYFCNYDRHSPTSTTFPYE